jgi:hypothetical protein
MPITLQDLLNARIPPEAALTLIGGTGAGLIAGAAVNPAIGAGVGLIVAELLRTYGPQIARAKAAVGQRELAELGPLPGPTAKPGSTQPGVERYSSRVCVYQGDVEGEVVFAGIANRLRDRGYTTHRVTRREQALSRIQEYTRISHLVLAGHGDREYFFGQWGTGLSLRPAQLATALRGRLISTSVISLAGCLAGLAEGETFDPANPDGGAGSFAGQLRDALIEQGAPDGGVIKAHTTTGPAATNPHVRAFYVHRGEVWQPGRGARFGSTAAAETWLLSTSHGLGSAPGLGFDVPITWPMFVMAAVGFGLLVTASSAMPKRR